MSGPSSLESFRFFYNKVGHPILVVESKSLQIRYLNPAAYTLKGLDQDETTGQGLSLADYFSDEGAEEIDALCSLSLKSTQTLNAKSVPLRKRSRRTLYVDINASRIQMANEDLIVLSLYDTSELVDIEKQKREDLLERAHLARLADIGSLAAGVAHELNNPLMIVLGHAENIEYSVQQAQFTREEVLEPLGQIIGAVDRMGKIVRKILTAARTESTSTATTDPSQLVEGALKMVMLEYSDQEVLIERDYAAQGLFRCDPLQIEQVLINIIKNAFQALSEKPTDRKIHLSTRWDRRGLLIEIGNNGPEIPGPVREQIFAPFFTTKEVGQGTGLGLSIAQGILQAHRATIEVSSRQNDTRFSILFPEARVEQSKAS